MTSLRVCAVCAVCAAWLWGVHAYASCEGARTPFDYPIVLKGPAALAGTRVNAVSVYAFKNGAFHDVSVQIEEVNDKGDYVLIGGLPYTRATDDGRFDANDELALDGADLGDDFPLDGTTPKPRGVTGRRWKLDLCRGTQSIGHVLIVDHGKPYYTPSPAQPAVRFNREKGELVSSLYRYRFDAKHPALLGEVMLKQGDSERPALRDSRFRMPLKTPFFVPDLMFTEDDFESVIESWQTGPVRTIVAVGVKYSAFLSLFKLHLFSELVFYRNRFVIPTVIEFIFEPSSVLNPGSGIAYSLKFPEGRSWTVEANLEPLPAASPKEVVASGKTAAATDVFVVRGNGPDGAFLAQVRVDPKARAMVPPPFLIRPEQFASPSHQKYWPWLKELPGDLGVYLDFSRVHKGLYDFGLDLLLSSKADESFKDYGSVDASWQHLPPGK